MLTVYQVKISPRRCLHTIHSLHKLLRQRTVTPGRVNDRWDVCLALLVSLLQPAGPLSSPKQDYHGRVFISYPLVVKIAAGRWFRPHQIASVCLHGGVHLFLLIIKSLSSSLPFYIHSDMSSNSHLSITSCSYLFFFTFY